MTPGQGPAAEAHLDDLRRRLYRADATEEDLRRFLAEQAAVAPAPPQEPPSRGPARHSAGQRAAVVGVMALAVIAMLIVGVRLGQPTASLPRPTPARAMVLQQDVSDGRLLTAGVSGPETVATSIRGTAVVGQQYHGRGSAVVPFAPPAGTTDGGRALVVLTSGGPGPTAWRALRLRTSADWSSQPIALARGTADLGAAVATPITFVYPGHPPAQIAVEAPDGVRWTLLIAATGRLTDELH